MLGNACYLIVTGWLLVGCCLVVWFLLSLCCGLLILCCVNGGFVVFGGFGCWFGLVVCCVSVLFVSLGLCFVLLGNFLLDCLCLRGFVNSVAVLRCFSLVFGVLQFVAFVVGYGVLMRVIFPGYFCLLHFVADSVAGLIGYLVGDFALCLYWLLLGLD